MLLNQEFATIDLAARYCPFSFRTWHTRATDSLVNPIKYSKCLQSYSASYGTCVLSPSQISLPTLWSCESGRRYYRSYQHNSTKTPLTTRYTVQEGLFLNHTMSEIHNVWPITNLCLFCVPVTSYTNIRGENFLCIPLDIKTVYYAG
jgi:hypothetical protein